jgi:hypothetical protein
MYYCEQCARPVEPVEPNRSSQSCPRCGAPLKQEQQAGWVNVARLTNLAEAGFLADELVSEGLEARIYSAESFSALTDNWSLSYMIQVPSASAQEAAARIRQWLADEQAHEQYMAGRHGDEDAVNPVDWRPVAVVLVAGAMCFVLGHQFALRTAERQPLPRNSLPATIDAIGQPLLTEPMPGKPRHRLSYQRREQAWLLDTDTDGDGRFETRRHYHTTGVGR